MSDKLQQLINLIAGLDPSAETHFTKSGLPDSRVLTEKLGAAVSATERDEAFTAFKEQQPEAAAEMLAALTPGALPASEPEEAATEMITGQDALKHLRGKGHKV